VLAMILFWDLLKPCVQYVGKLADSVQDLSVAVEKIADKDDRQAEEMQRLSQFAAQQGERSFEILRAQASQIEKALAQLDRIERVVSKEQ
jgi:hypothetical protein